MQAVLREFAVLYIKVPTGRERTVGINFVKEKAAEPAKKIAGQVTGPEFL